MCGFLAVSESLSVNECVRVCLRARLRIREISVYKKDVESEIVFESQELVKETSKASREVSDIPDKSLKLGEYQ